uniref:Secreted peptide n=1 Tax=Rhizophora mucronata TaxID=61149 RepID=A0A2P2QGN1_RHIMU
MVVCLFPSAFAMVILNMLCPVNALLSLLNHKSLVLIPDTIAACQFVSCITIQRTTDSLFHYVTALVFIVIFVMLYREV